MLLESYAYKNGYSPIRYFTDDGVSRTTFEREGFQSMIAEVEAGNVGAVIVKDTASIYTPDPVWKRKLDKLVEKNPQCYQCVKADEVSKTYSNRILRSRKPHKVLGYAYPLFVPSALFKVGKED